MIIRNVEMEDADKLDYAPWNYKLDATADQEEKFFESLKKNGFTYGLIVAQRAETPEDDMWETCDGNHRLKVLKKNGIAKIPVYKVGRLSLEERIRISLELNEWRFEINSISLADCFSKFKSSAEDVAKTLPISVEDVKKLMNLYQFDGSDFKLPDENFEDKFIDALIYLKFDEDQSTLITKLFEKLKEKGEYSGRMNTIEEMIVCVVGDKKIEGEKNGIKN